MLGLVTVPALFVATGVITLSIPIWFPIALLADAVRMREGKFSKAAGGTLFLDEIGETSGPLQAKLLRVLQEREVRPVGGTRTRRVDVRLIAATNRDREAMVKEGEYREDLLFRLNVVPIMVPALRERRDDVEREYFINGHFDVNDGHGSGEFRRQCRCGQWRRRYGRQFDGSEQCGDRRDVAV